jgi:hypothetical protein
LHSTSSTKLLDDKNRCCRALWNAIQLVIDMDTSIDDAYISVEEGHTGAWAGVSQMVAALCEFRINCQYPSLEATLSSTLLQEYVRLLLRFAGMSAVPPATLALLWDAAKAMMLFITQEKIVAEDTDIRRLVCEALRRVSLRHGGFRVQMARLSAKGADIAQLWIQAYKIGADYQCRLELLLLWQVLAMTAPEVLALIDKQQFGTAEVVGHGKTKWSDAEIVQALQKIDAALLVPQEWIFVFEAGKMAVCSEDLGRRVVSLFQGTDPQGADKVLQMDRVVCNQTSLVLSGVLDGNIQIAEIPLSKLQTFRVLRPESETLEICCLEMSLADDISAEELAYRRSAFADDTLDHKDGTDGHADEDPRGQLSRILRDSRSKTLYLTLRVNAKTEEEWTAFRAVIGPRIRAARSKSGLQDAKGQSNSQMPQRVETVAMPKMSVAVIPKEVPAVEEDEVHTASKAGKRSAEKTKGSAEHVSRDAEKKTSKKEKNRRLLESDEDDEAKEEQKRRIEEPPSSENQAVPSTRRPSKRSLQTDIDFAGNKRDRAEDDSFLPNARSNDVIIEELKPKRRRTGEPNAVENPTPMKDPFAVQSAASGSLRLAAAKNAKAVQKKVGSKSNSNAAAIAPPPVSRRSNASVMPEQQKAQLFASMIESAFDDTQTISQSPKPGIASPTTVPLDADFATVLAHLHDIVGQRRAGQQAQVQSLRANAAAEIQHHLDAGRKNLADFAAGRASQIKADLEAVEEDAIAEAAALQAKLRELRRLYREYVQHTQDRMARTAAEVQNVKVPQLQRDIEERKRKLQEEHAKRVKQVNDQLEADIRASEQRILQPLANIKRMIHMAMTEGTPAKH